MSVLRSRSGRILALLVVATAALAAAPAAAAESAVVCDLPSSGHAPPEDEQRGCLSVTASLDDPPAVGESARLSYAVRSAVAGDVRISVDLPPNLRWTSAPAGSTVTDRVSAAPQSKGVVQRAETVRPMAAGEILDLGGSVTAVATGPAEILVRASTEQPYGVEAGGDEVFLTIAAAGQRSRFGIPASTMSAAVRYDGPAPEVPAAPAKAVTATPEQPPADREIPSPSDRAGEPAVERSGAAAVTGVSCVTGSWNFVDHKGVARAARQWRVEAWDDDSSTGNANDFLAAGTTGFDGRYSLCFNSADTGGAATQDVFVVFIADAGNWRVEGNAGGTYSYGSGVVWNVPANTTREIGWLQPGVPNQHRAAHAFQALSDAWNGTPGACWDMVSACRPVVVRWAPDSTVGTFYDPNTNLVRLKAVDPDSRQLVVHEAAHSIMDDVYDDVVFSAPNCANHQIHVTSSKGCAWQEGFADWLPTYIYNDPHFRWPNGAALNLETPTWGTPGWSNFDTTEGRVAGALLDLVDSANDGFDTYGEGVSSIWHTFQWHNSPTFRDFWTHRSIDGFTIGQAPRAALHQNTIDY